MTRILSILMNHGLLKPEVSMQINENAKAQNTPLLRYIVQQNHVNATTIAHHLVKDFALTLFDLQHFELSNIPPTLLNIHLCLQYQFLPLFKQDDTLQIGIADPTQTQWMDKIKFYYHQHTIQWVLVEADQLFYHLDNLSLLDDKTTVDTPKSDQKNQVNHDTAVVQFIDNIMTHAIGKQASDIHFEPYDGQYRIRFRIDGVLKTMTCPTTKMAKQFAARLKVMGNLDLSEKRLPQDGRFKFNLPDKHVCDFRISTCPTLFGEKIVLRLLDNINKPLDIQTLGLSGAQNTLLTNAIEHPQGMVLVTGPTGSGKTQTLYTCLTHLNTDEKNISTVEDPIEINLSGINQVPINLKAGLTFSRALRAFLRQDPDIIMIGEMRDLETADIAIKAAQTGHLVFSTLHTNSAIETITRLRNMGVAAFNIAASVTLIIAQRLVRSLCQHCKIADKIPAPVLINAGMIQDDIHTATCYKAVGCHHCHHGYQGRFALYEMLPIDRHMTQAIMQNDNNLAITTAIKQKNFVSLRQAGLQAVCSGKTSLAEIERITQSDY